MTKPIDGKSYWGSISTFFGSFIDSDTQKKSDDLHETTKLSTCGSFAPSKSQRTRIEKQDLIASTQPSVEASELESRAKLSYGTQVVDKASQFFWWTASLPRRGTSAVVTKCKDCAVNMVVQQVAKKGVNFLGTSAPDTPLQRLKNCLFELSESVSKKIVIDEPLRQRTMLALGVFLADHKKYLADCYSPGAWISEGLNRDQESKFRTLLNALDERKNLANEEKFLRPLCEFIDRCCCYQNESHKSKLAEQFVGKMTTVLPSTETNNNTTTKSVKIESRPKIQLPPQKPVVENPLPLIVKEFEELKSLGFRIGLALLILPEECMSNKPEEENGKKTEGESRVLAALIQKSNSTLDPLKGPDEIFQNLIYIEIDNSNLNYLQKKWKKFTCWLLAPAVVFIVDHVLDQTKDIALHLIGLSPEDRLDMVVKMFIKPGLGFIGWLQSQYRSISNIENLGTTVEEAIGTAIDQIKIRDRHGQDLTSKDLINRLISSLIDKYVPSLNWSKSATAHFEQRAQDSKSPFLSLWFISWSYLTWAVNILTAPGRWCLNKILRKVLKTAVVSQLHAKLTDKDGASWDFGKLALNSIYKTLFVKLQKINRSDRETETENTRKTLALEQRGFVEKNVQDSIKKLVSNFLELLDIQGSNVNNLHAKLSPANFFEQGKKGVMGLAYAPGIQKATEEIIHGLQVFLEDKTFSAGLLDVIQDIHRQCLSFNTGDTDTSLARLERDFSVELKDAVKLGIQGVIEGRLDPSKHIQAEADLFIDGLKHDAKEFRDHFSEVQNFTPHSLKKLTILRDKYLIDSIRRRRETANSETNASTRVHIKTASDQFNTHTTPICAKIEDLVKLADTRKKIEESTEDLGQLITPLKAAQEAAITKEPLNAADHYRQLELTLQRIKTKTYPERVQTLISKLQGHFDVWRTETLKKDNQAILNGTIGTLIASVETAIEQNINETARLTELITKKALKTQQLVENLVEWTHQLSYFVCVSERQEIDAFEHFAAFLGNQGLSPLILGKLDDFFIFLGTNHNIKGLLSFVIKAYLELPKKSPKEVKKILDKVMLRAQELPVIPKTRLFI
jgi:hypothetical protein